MKGAVLFVIGILLGGGSLYAWNLSRKIPVELPLPSESKFAQKPLEKYEIENLGRREYKGSHIILDEAVATAAAYTAHRFHYESDGKRVNGLAHIPSGDGPFPVIIQSRGYAELEGYQSGNGTRRSAVEYAKAGFISLAPDFLGYGGSDNPSDDVWEARFETYTTVLNLLASIQSLPKADTSKVGLWGHSNGGHITLTILEISQKEIPVTLWAPVAAAFPYSVLYYTYDYDDGGKALRKSLAEFERNYDVNKFTMINYLDRIQGSVQIHQGTHDPDIPMRWTNELVTRLKDKNKDVTYWTYVGADHNMQPQAWSTVVERDIRFFKEKLDSGE